MEPGTNNGNQANGSGPKSDANASGFVNPGIAKPIWETAQGGTIDGGTGNGNERSAETPIKRGRGRPPGSGNKTAAPGKTEAPVSVSVSSLEKLLLTIHATLALGTARAELNLDDDEAKQLAKALLEVQAQYKVVLDPRTAAWMNLFMVAAPIYGSRAVAIWMERIANEQPQPETTTEKPEAQPAKAAERNSPQVIDMHGIKFDPGNIKLHS